MTFHITFTCKKEAFATTISTWVWETDLYSPPTQFFLLSLTIDNAFTYKWILKLISTSFSRAMHIFNCHIAIGITPSWFLISISKISHSNSSSKRLWHCWWVHYPTNTHVHVWPRLCSYCLFHVTSHFSFILRSGLQSSVLHQFFIDWLENLNMVSYLSYIMQVMSLQSLYSKNVLTVRKSKFGSSKGFLCLIARKLYLIDSGTAQLPTSSFQEDPGFWSADQSVPHDPDQ